MPLRTLIALTLAVAIVPAACGGEPAGGAAQDDAGSPAATESPTQEARLGPKDGRNLPPHDLERVAAGDTAPDFTLASYAAGPVTLSDFRGSKDVILVFYRGHW